MDRQTLIPYELSAVPRPGEREIYIRPIRQNPHQRPSGSDKHE